MIPRPLALAIVLLVSLVWAGNWALVGLSAVGWIGAYQSDVSLNGIFMVVVGGALIASRRRDPTGGGDQDVPELPEGVPEPPGYGQLRRTVAELLDPDRDRREGRGPQ